MMNLCKRLILLEIIITLANQLSITNLLLNNTLPLHAISDSYVALNGESLYLIHSKQQTGLAQLIKYKRNQQKIEYQLSLTTETNFNIYWEIYNLEEQIMSFPIQIRENITFYQNSKFVATILSKQIIFRAVWVKSKSLIFLSTVSGTIAYATKASFIKGNITYLANSNHFGNTFLSFSPDQKYLCSTDVFTGLVSIWSIQNLTIVKQIWLNQTGMRSHTWSDDSNQLFVFGYQSGIMYRFNSQANFIYNCYESSRKITYSFYYYQAREIVAISANNSQLNVFNINTLKTSLIQIGLENPYKLKVDSSKKYFTVFNQTDLAFFKIDSYCNLTQFFNLTSTICESCQVGCQICDQFYCYSCKQDYYLNQTKCVYTPPSNTSSFNQFTSDLTKKTFLVINSTMSVAGYRQFLSTFFQFFSNFDRFVLYIYHDRVYGTNMQIILKQIHDTVDYRFQIFSKDICSNYLGLDFTNFEDSVDYKQNYSIKTYYDLQQSGQGFFQSNIQYFLLNIPLILITLFAYRIAFRLLINYRFSIFIRRFSFWGILLLLLLQGNVELFFFSFTGDFLTFFSINYRHKLFNVLTCYTAFIFLILSTVGYLYLFIIYKKNSKYFYDNCHPLYQSGLYFLIVNGWFSILRGMIHRIIITQPQIQAIILFFLELGQGCLIIFCQKNIKIFISSFVSVLFCSGNFSRALFNLTFLMSNTISLVIIDYIHASIFFFNVITFLISIIMNLLEFIIKIKKMFFDNKIANFIESTEKKQDKNIFEIKNNHQGSQLSKVFETNKLSKGVTFKLCRKKVKTILNVTFKQKQKQQCKKKKLWKIVIVD